MCGRWFTAEEWNGRHSHPEDCSDVHARCCPRPECDAAGTSRPIKITTPDGREVDVTEIAERLALKFWAEIQNVDWVMDMAGDMAFEIGESVGVIEDPENEDDATFEFVVSDCEGAMFQALGEMVAGLRDWPQ